MYRNFVLLSRFQFQVQKDGTFRIVNYQESDESKQYDLNDVALECAMYSVEHHWELIAHE